MSYIKLVFILSLTFQIVFGADLKSEGETDRDKALKHVALMLSLDDPSSASDNLISLFALSEEEVNKAIKELNLPKKSLANESASYRKLGNELASENNGLVDENISKEEFNKYVEVADSILGKSMQRMSMNGIESATYMSADSIDKVVEKLEPMILAKGLGDKTDSEMMKQGFDKGLEMFKQMNMKINDSKIYMNDAMDNFSILSMSMSTDVGGTSTNMDMIVVQYMNAKEMTSGMKDHMPEAK